MLETLGLVAILVLLVRFGLVAVLAFFLFLFPYTVTLDTTSFYFSSTLVWLVFYLAIALYAFYISLAGQPLFGKGFLEDADT